MDKATKAALFSALLFPGWGQFYLKQFLRGLFFIVPVLVGSLLLAWSIIQASISIIKAAPFKKGTVQVDQVFQVTINALKTINISFFLIVLLLIVLLWILSVIDAYQLGKKLTTEPATDADPGVVSDQP